MSDKRELALRLSRIRAVLLKKYPFFGSLVMHLRLSVASCGTACTDMKKIYFDPDFAEHLSDEEVEFVMMHEVMHCVLKHPLRGKGLMHEIYNIACDIVVNSNILECMKLKDFTVDGCPAMHLTPSGVEGRLRTAEQVYKELLENGEELTGLDSHEIWEGLEADGNVFDEWDKLAHEFGSKYYGTIALPQTMRDIMDELMNEASLRWKDLLRDYLTYNTYYNDYTFAPPDRRFSDAEYFLPADNQYEMESVQNIWFCIDTSGSISKEQLSRLYGEVSAVTREFTGFKGFVSFFDTSVTEPVPFSEELDPGVVRPMGGGGTSFKSIFYYMHEHMMDNPPNAVVILTDGYAEPVEEGETCGVPVLWILVNNPEDMDIGQTIHITV